MDNLPLEVRQIIIMLVPEAQWGPLRATSRALLAQIGQIVGETWLNSPASFAPDRIYSMVNWLRRSGTPPDQKFRIVLKHMPRRGLVRWMLRRHKAPPRIVAKFAGSILTMAAGHYSQAERARVLALFGQKTPHNNKIAVRTGVIDLVDTNEISAGEMAEALQRENYNVAYLLADNLQPSLREKIRGAILEHEKTRRSVRQ